MESDVTLFEKDARQIASEWHGGQSSGLYAFASTGYVSEDARLEAIDCLRTEASVVLARGNVCDLAYLITFLDRSVSRIKLDNPDIIE
jgi:hypothetical protein